MTAVNSDIDALAEPFKFRCERLIAMIATEGLPLRLFETRRSFSRSAALFMQGRTYENGVIKKIGPTVTNARSGEGPHCWGLAADFVLITGSPKEPHDWWHEDGPATSPWDSGYEGGKLVRPIAKLAWERYGRCVRACDLSWGGTWAGFVDLPHAEFAAWATLRPPDWKKIVEREIALGR